MGLVLFPRLVHGDEDAIGDDSLKTEEPSTATEEFKETLTADELLKTEAGEAFTLRKYEEALVGFQALTQQYPKDVKIRRYLGASEFYLKRFEEAADTFQEILSQYPSDLPSRQFLAKTYMRQAKLDEAEKELSFLLQNDKTGALLTFAKTQLDAIQRIRESESKLAGQAEGRQLTPTQFLETDAAKFFVSAEYEKSLEALNALESQYPEDLTVKRYRAIALDKLSRFDEAITAFDEGLAIAARNTALHYFKSQTLVHQQKYPEASEELQFVIDYDTGNAYKPRAVADKKSVEQIIAYLSRPKPKPWSLTLTSGSDYNTNASSESRITRSINEEHAFKFSNSLNFGYNEFQNGPWSGRFSYSYSTALYSDTIDYLNTFSHTVGQTFTHSGTLFEKPLISQIGANGTHTILDTKYYTHNFAPSLTEIYSLADWWRVTLTGRITYTDYKSTGTNADRTSKEGPAYSVDAANNFYLTPEKNRYVQIGYEYGVDEFEGSNFVKDIHAVRGNYYFPFFWGWSAQAKFKYKFTDYPEYTTPPATAPVRYDEELTTGGSLTIPLPHDWTLTAQYTYTNAQSKDNTYTYINHAGGGSLSYSF